jgi:hypothetical protein
MLALIVAGCSNAPAGSSGGNNTATTTLMARNPRRKNTQTPRTYTSVSRCGVAVRTG